MQTARRTSGSQACPIIVVFMDFLNGKNRKNLQVRQAPSHTEPRAAKGGEAYTDLLGAVAVFYLIIILHIHIPNSTNIIHNILFERIFIIPYFMFPVIKY
jgi:hypothetical protein